MTLPTREQLLAMADESEAEADKLERDARATAVVLRAQAKHFREAARQVLTIDRQDSIVHGAVQADVAMRDRFVRQAASRSRTDSKVKKRLLEAGYTDSRIAKILKVGRSTVNAWYSGRNAIPDRHVTTLSKPPYNVPRSDWPRID